MLWGGLLYSSLTPTPPIHFPRVEYLAPGARKEDPDGPCTDDQPPDGRLVGVGCYMNNLIIDIGVGSYMDAPSHSLKLYSGYKVAAEATIA